MMFGYDIMKETDCTSRFSRGQSVATGGVNSEWFREINNASSILCRKRVGARPCLS